MTKHRKRKQQRQQPRSVGVRSSAPPDRATAGRIGARAVWISIGLCVAIALVYFPVRHYGFVDLDDPQYISENPHIAHGLTWPAISWAFTSVYASYWLPVIWLSHMLDVQLYGLNAGGHHVTNVLLHGANTVLLFALLDRLTGATGRSALVAALFAVHPLRVESVVWVTERKDVLSTLFLLLTIWFYASYARSKKMSRYLLALVCFALGLMSKSMLVTIPFALLLLDVWPLRRIELSEWRGLSEQRAAILRLVREKLPFFGLAVASAVVTYLTQQRTGAVSSTDRISLAFRVGNALVSYAWYIGKLIWPSNLALFYPYPLAVSPWIAAASALGLLAVSVLLVRRIKENPYLAVGWFWYIGTLVPVIGIIQAGDQARADRFTYVPLIGLFIVIAWGGFELAGRYRITPILAALGVVALAGVARIQVGYWRTNSVLWEHALNATTESYVAHTNLGLALYGDGKIDDAITHYRAALRLRPDFAEAHNDLGVALANRGETDAAIQSFLNALRAKPGQAASHYNAAVLLAAKGDSAAAGEHLESALRLSPGYEDARRMLNRLRRR
jgi:hypothetical protein